MSHVTFGDPRPVPTQFEKSSRISFRPDFPLKWDDCSITANFVCQYYAGVIGAGKTPAEVREINHSIGYMVNELVENAVKFRLAGPVEVALGLVATEFVLRIENAVPKETSDRFQHLLEELTAGDPGELMIERIEANAIAGNSGGSGLGILTLMNDYGVAITWNFRPSDEDPEKVELETIARLPLP